MIQRTDIRPTSSAVTSPRLNGPDVWEVVQHPLRARMCGFGDKDRRPLAPAAVAKMIIRRDDDSIVDVDEVDCSFFLVTVDLWSADGKHEMNLVLHPSSADRYAPTNPSSKTRRRGASASTQARPSGNQTPAGRSSPPPGYRAGDQTGNSTPSLSAHAPYPNQGYFAPQPAPGSEHIAYPQAPPYGPPPPDPSSTWGYPPPTVDRTASFPPPILPSIHSFGRRPPAPQTPGNAAYPPVDSYPNSQQHLDPALRAPSSSTDTRDGGWSQQPGGYNSTAMVIKYPQPVPGSPALLHAPAATSSPLPRHTYTRTLVGPLSANACRLLDEHRKPGIFFLFQDLSVRTEGTFRLRMRLMNVGAPPAPENGATRVHNDVSPVLAQTFTDPFTVFSAKRFPGVPDTTALSIAFGNQGQKLPLRNRHGSSKRRRRGGSESDEDSDA
ncbi:hypothetical protein NLJ89_g1228 [Agrocybe chaxingu]|uniref:Velvet domain-containing protein n=1 Tax=Agrocybe chaxingu TaxID=84603 RepID=A0A9W8N0G1_9AGAR|nr:hypothetical protein NLJ89_g1228 [Agrocybe chaxingu]